MDQAGIGSDALLTKRLKFSGVGRVLHGNIAAPSAFAVTAEKESREGEIHAG
jgi:hypothetical protein